MAEIVLSQKQIEAFDKIMEFHKDPDRKTFVLAGYAGAGKTSLAKRVAAEIGEGVVFCAYTGKAVNVLREKGCDNVTTIHSALYKIADHDKSELNRLKDELGRAHDSWRRQAIQEQIDRIRHDHKKLNFTLGDGNAFRSSKLVIVDEYSMLERKLIGDLEAAGKKILYLGDPFQLPPVQGECPLVPDHFIEEIHRQALESSIVRFSKDVREGREIPLGRHGDFEYLGAGEATTEDYTSADQIICGKNNTRHAINKWFREMSGNIQYKLPVKGEKLICLKNNHAAGLFNGMIGTALEDGEKEKEYDIKYKLQFEGITDPIWAWEGDVLGQSDDYNWNDFKMRNLNRFDYASAITCHKSQGSEFGNVLVCNEPIGKDDVMMRRWLYTAITRGKKKVTLVQS